MVAAVAKSVIKALATGSELIIGDDTATGSVSGSSKREPCNEGAFGVDTLATGSVPRNLAR